MNTACRKLIYGSTAKRFVCDAAATLRWWRPPCLPPPSLRQHLLQPPHPQPAASDDEADLVVIKSPMVGTFYSRPNPESDSFVQVGQDISADTTICIIEAMKVFNEIAAEVAGKVVSVLVEDEEPGRIRQAAVQGPTTRLNQVGQRNSQRPVRMRATLAFTRTVHNRPSLRLPDSMYNRILIANRGEIALRVIRACREMGIESVVIFSEADRGSAYLDLADEAICVGKPRNRMSPT